MKHFRIILILLSLASLVACSHEDIYPSEEMSFTASLCKDGSSVETKSAASPIVIPFGDDMGLSIEESDIQSPDETFATKGMVVTGDNFNELIGRKGRFFVTAYNSDEAPSSIYIRDYFRYDGQYWKPIQSTVWPDFPLQIIVSASPNYVYYSLDSDVDPYSQSEYEDNYSRRTLLRDNTYYLFSDDMYFSEDYLFAKATCPANNTEPLNLSFKHISTAVKFKTSSDIPSGVVKSIFIGGIFVNKIFNCDTEQWEDKPHDYYPDPIVIGVEGGNNSNYLNVATTSGVAGTPISNEYQTVFLPPQVCDGAFIRVNFQYEGETEVQTYDIPLPDGFEFKMGKLITFQIGMYSNHLPVTGGWFDGSTNL